MNKNTQAFTLVELIVVITILAILGTIAFISLQGYSRDARDSVRISDMKNIEKGFELEMTKNGKLTIPDDYVEITASGTTISYQGYAGQNVLNIIGVRGEVKDPLDKIFYTYVTNTKLNKYQILGYLESDEVVFNNDIIEITNALDLSERFPTVGGNKLGVLLDLVTKEPVQVSGEGVDIVNTNTGYIAYLNNSANSIVKGTGSTLYTRIYNSREDLLNNKELASLDENLVLYYDMETTTLSGSEILIKDLSGYGNNGKAVGFVQLGDSNGIKGKATKFNRAIGYYNISVPDSDSLNIKTNEFTLSVRFKLSVNLEDTASKYPILIYKRPWLVGGYASHFVRGLGLNVQYCLIDSCKSVGTNGFVKGQWYHYIGIKEQDKLRIYIDGKMVKVLDITGKMGLSTGQDLYIGENFEGIIDEVRIYDRLLVEQEVFSLYNLKQYYEQKQ